MRARAKRVTRRFSASKGPAPRLSAITGLRTWRFTELHGQQNYCVRLLTSLGTAKRDRSCVTGVDTLHFFQKVTTVNDVVKLHRFGDQFFGLRRGGF